MRVLITGSAGIVGREVVRGLRAHGGDVALTPVTRRPAAADEVAWALGAGPPPPEAAGPWDVVVHAAASTRWSMTREEATAANVAPTAALLELIDERTHLVHLSTAYADGVDPATSPVASGFGRYRNGYEWSKGECEALVRRHPGPVTIVRPPLIVGARTDGSIGRFSGPYTMVQSLVSGLAAAVVGDPDGYAEIAPVDQVAEVVVAAVLGRPPTATRTEVIAGGTKSLRLRQLLDLVCGTLNEWRAARDIPPIEAPPFIPTRRWHRFFLPLAEEHLSPVQLEVVRLLGMFESYTSLAEPFEPTQQVTDPEQVLVTSVRWWAERKPRLAARIPEPWQIVG
jgi:nucleoside-diphosphate-sugar epimerase